jgi:uncharacterized protein YndB with AHSA1/START domain
MEKQNEKNDTLIIRRVFNAPRELVFRVMTETEHLARWWGPAGTTLEVLQADIRPGGRFHYCMHLPDGGKMYALFLYLEIEAPNRLVLTNSFADENGNIVNDPFTGSWPLKMHHTFHFSEADGKTELTLHVTPVDATEEQVRTFIAGFESMQGGYAGTFDQLVQLLETLTAKN